jgi:hypothetical protein
MAGRLTLFMPGKTDAHFSWELLLVSGCTDFAHHIPPNAVVAEGVLENKMPSHPGPGRSRGCGCRLTKGLHGHRLVILDVEDGI